MVAGRSPVPCLTAVVFMPESDLWVTGIPLSAYLSTSRSRVRDRLHRMTTCEGDSRATSTPFVRKFILLCKEGEFLPLSARNPSTTVEATVTSKGQVTLPKELRD